MLRAGDIHVANGQTRSVLPDEMREVTVVVRADVAIGSNRCSASRAGGATSGNDLLDLACHRLRLLQRELNRCVGFGVLVGFEHIGEQRNAGALFVVANGEAPDLNLSGTRWHWPDW